MPKWNRIQRCFMMFAALPLFFVSGLRLPAQAAGAADGSWLQELLMERQRKDMEFKTSATSPMAGATRLTIKAAEKTFVAIVNGDVTLQPRASAETVFAVFARKGEWLWADAAPGVLCRLGEGVVAPNVDALAAGSLFTAGRFTLAVYPGTDTLALIVFDPQRPQQVAFEHLHYFPPDPAYAVKARLVKFSEKKAVTILTTRKLEKTFYRYARIHFMLAGRDLELTALKSSLEGPDANTLFIAFKDGSNGRETYEVGRFIDVPEPESPDFILDFNRCYNPLCNYSPAYNCPLPPLENFLEIDVPAGEKTYPH